MENLRLCLPEDCRNAILIGALVTGLIYFKQRFKGRIVVILLYTRKGNTIEKA